MDHSHLPLSQIKMANHNEIVFANSYFQRKALTMGLLDLAAFTTSAHELKIHLNVYAAHRTVLYWTYIAFILISMSLQVSIGLFQFLAASFSYQNNIMWNRKCLKHCFFYH